MPGRPSLSTGLRPGCPMNVDHSHDVGKVTVPRHQNCPVIVVFEKISQRPLAILGSRAWKVLARTSLPCLRLARAYEANLNPYHSSSGLSL